MLELASGPCRILIDLGAGGRLASWQVNEHELLVSRDSGPHPFGWGSYAMVPWPGRLRDGRFTFDGEEAEFPRDMAPHAIHGTVFDTPWEHLSGGSEWAMLGARLARPWPFGGSVTHLLHVLPDALVQTLTVVAGDRAMPAGLGWHPWFRRRLDSGGPLELDVDMHGAALLKRDRTYLPTGRTAKVPPRPWDDCFVGVGSIALRWPGVLRLDVTHDCSHVVLYDPTNAICVEPQSCAPDDFNVAPHTVRLEPGEVLEHTVTWRWTMASRPA